MMGHVARPSLNDDIVVDLIAEYDEDVARRYAIVKPARDSRAMCGDGPFVFAQVTNGVGVRGIADAVIGAWTATKGR